MAAITGQTAAPGGGYYNFSDTASWQGGVVPGAGDSITTTQPVLIDADATFGTDGASLTIDWAASAEVVVGGNVTVTAKGDIRMANAPLTFRSGSKWKLDGSAGASADTYRRIVLGSAVLQPNACLKTDGVLSPRAQIESVLTGNGGRGQITITSSNGNGRWDVVDGLNVVNLGLTGSRDAVIIAPAANAAYHVRIRNTTFDNCQSQAAGDSASLGTLQITAVPDGADHELTNVAFVNSVSFRNMNVTGLAGTAYTGGTRTWTNCKFDRGVATSAGKITATNCIFDASPNNASGGLSTRSSLNVTEWVLTNCLVRNGTYALGSPSSLPLGTWTDLVFIRDTNTVNPHYAAVERFGNLTIDGAIFWSNATDMSQPGDIILVGATPATATRTLVIKKVISLDPPGGQSAGTVTFFNSTNYLVTYEHNTIGSTSDTHGGISFGENGTIAAGSFVSVKSNIAYRRSGNTVGGGRVGEKHNLATIEADSIVSMGWNALSRINSATTLFNMPSNAFVGGHDPEQGRLVADAAFVDDSRTPLTFNTAQGGPGTLADFMARMHAGTDVPATFTTYIRAGFLPTNTAYASAGHDGTTIGAVQMAGAGGGGGFTPPTSSRRKRAVIAAAAAARAGRRAA
jgi:hypothetical protein